MRFEDAPTGGGALAVALCLCRTGGGSVRHRGWLQAHGRADGRGNGQRMRRRVCLASSAALRFEDAPTSARRGDFFCGVRSGCRDILSVLSHRVEIVTNCHPIPPPWVGSSGAVCLTAPIPRDVAARLTNEKCGNYAAIASGAIYADRRGAFASGNRRRGIVGGLGV